VAPVTKRSGKTCIVVMRYAAQIRLRQAVFHWARAAVQNDPKVTAAIKLCAPVAIPTAVPCAARRPDVWHFLRPAAAARTIQPSAQHNRNRINTTIL
jgi:hypothetical protein